MRTNQKKRKLLFKNECESEEIDDPSEVEGEGSYTVSNENTSAVAGKKIKLFLNVDQNGDNSHETSEEGPPSKKAKLTVGNYDENNQNNVRELSEIQTDEKELEDECNYENINANFFIEDLSSDDEILTFQCPQNFDVTSLLGKTIDLSKESKIKDDNNKYICDTIQNSIKNKLNCIFPSKKGSAVFLKLPLAGHIMLRKKIKIHNQKIGSLIDVDSEMEVPIFDSMKRHPLLGTEWKDHFDKVKKELKKHKKLLRRSLRHEKSLVKAERERKEQKKKLKNELTLLKKKQLHDFDYL